MEETSKPKSTKKKVGSIIVNVLIWTFVAFSVVITVLAFMANSNSDGVPTIGGRVISPVLSPSMEPTIKKGDIILSRKLDDDKKDSLEVNNIISFKADLDGDGTPEVNTHRIIERIVDANNSVSYKTKGDNNEYQDNYTVYPSDVISIFDENKDTRIPVLGNVIEFLLQPTGFFICIVIPLILFFLFEIIMFVRKVIEVKNSDKKQITAEDEEMIKKKAIEEYLRSQAEAEAAAASENKAEDEMIKKKAIEEYLHSQAEAEAAAASENKAELVIDAESAHSANAITVYLDGGRLCEINGGTTKTIKIEPGYHQITSTVYNDASETAYSLGESSGDFKANESYTLKLG